jgi:hypothetical protein
MGVLNYPPHHPQEKNREAPSLHDDGTSDWLHGNSLPKIWLPLYPTYAAFEIYGLKY